MAKKTTAELSADEIAAALALATRHVAALQRLQRAQKAHADQQAILRTLMQRRRGQLADAHAELCESGALVWIERARADASAGPEVATRGADAGVHPAAAGDAATSDGLDLGGEIPPQ